MSVSVGSAAPAFNLPTDGDGMLALEELRGKKVVLYFYPKDSTPGCTTQAQEFRNFIDEFESLNTVIVGVSRDSVKRHDNFKAKNDLPFTLISDEKGTLCHDYDVWVEKKNYGRTYMGIERTTFLIDEVGNILNIWKKVRVKGHVANVLDCVSICNEKS